jgi:hypothetical protein
MIPMTDSSFPEFSRCDDGRLGLEIVCELRRLMPIRICLVLRWLHYLSASRIRQQGDFRALPFSFEAFAAVVDLRSFG